MMTGRRRDSMPRLHIFLCFAMLISPAICGPTSGEFGMFSFDVHHRFSDTIVKRFPNELPEKGSLRYYAEMVHRDLALHGRRLAGSFEPLTFKDGNRTRLIPILGFLHYAIVSVGSADESFIVALDTGSNLFWLPCDCQSCVTELKSPTGQRVELNIYSPKASNSSSIIPCYSANCYQQSRCNSSSSACPYVVEYLSEETSSSGYLVEDNLQLITDNSNTLQKRVSAKIIIGCGRVQTGAFLKNGAPNGLFGLGLSRVSVPSTLASQGLIADSFSLCFGSGTSGTGRITFGDKGSANQSTAPFQNHVSYNVTVAKTSVSGNPIDISFHVIVDTGTSFAYIGDPAYSAISRKYDELVTYPRFTEKVEDLPFEHCYDTGLEEDVSFPSLTLTMGNGAVFNVKSPVKPLQLTNGMIIFCLGIIKSHDIDIVGQNFMTGYRLVFDRERMVLGWETSDCNNFETTSFSPTASVAPASAPGSGSPSSNSSTVNPQIVVLPPNDSPVLFPATFLVAKTLIFYLFLVR